MIKALFVSPAAAVYGSEKSMLALLKQRSFHAAVVCPPEGELENQLHEMKVPICPLEFGKYSLKQNPLWHLGFLLRFWRILYRYKPDVVVINLEGNAPLVVLVAALLHIPVIRYCRFEFSPPERWIDRWCWRQSKAIVCPSEVVRQQVTQWLGVSNKTQVFKLYDPYMGKIVDMDEVREFRQRLSLTDEKVIGYMGRMHVGKRIETAIEALGIIRNSAFNAKLLIIGDDGSPEARTYRKILHQRAERCGVSSDVIFVGYIPHDKVSSAIAVMDVLVMPSESESFGMVLMEAWANGVPTVASDVGGCSEISLVSGGGFLAPVGDASEFARCLTDLLVDSEGASAMGEHGRAWVDKNCSPIQYAEKFNSIISCVVSGNPQ